MKPKLIRMTTVPMSLDILLKGQLAFMNNHFNVIGISSGPKTELETVGKREGVNIILVNMTRFITPFKDIKAVWKLFRVFRKERPLIVHTHTPKAGTVGMLAAKLAGVPHRLHTVAGMPLLEAVGAKRKLLDFVEKVTYSCATKIYPNSPGLKNIIIANKYVKKSKLKVIGVGSSNGIDTNYFDPAQVEWEKKDQIKKELGISSDDFVFIFIGRLVRDKGLNELIEAFDLLSRDSATVSRIKLILVGSYENELDPLKNKTIDSIESNSNIITAGFQKDVRPYLAISNVLTFPSYREGFPNVVLQAGAMGLPSIVTNINGCNEIVNHNENGIIIPVKNAEALYEAMVKFLQEEKFYQNLRKNARTLIITRYEQQLIWENILKEYNTIIN